MAKTLKPNPEGAPAPSEALGTLERLKYELRVAIEHEDNAEKPPNATMKIDAFELPRAAMPSCADFNVDEPAEPGPERGTSGVVLIERTPPEESSERPRVVLPKRDRTWLLVLLTAFLGLGLFLAAAVATKRRVGQ